MSADKPSADAAAIAEALHAVASAIEYLADADSNSGAAIESLAASTERSGASVSESLDVIAAELQAIGERIN